MPTNILKLPLVQGASTLGDNEDWLDTIAFQTAGLAAAYPASTNAGNATIGPVTAATGAKVGDSKVQITSVTSGVATFLVFDPDGLPLGIGTSGVPYGQGGLSFTLTAGATPSQVGDAYTIVVLSQPLDLTGISFAMQVRTVPTDAIFYADASTDNGQLVSGGTLGTLAINLPRSVQPIPVGSYGFDILATGDGIDRRCVTATLTVVAGYTKT